MHATLEVARDHDTAHPPQSAETTHHALPRLTLVDRLALRVGLALVLWSRRHTRHQPTRSQLVLQHREAEQRAERERRAAALATLTLPPR
jgi:hypothetical protein